MASSGPQPDHRTAVHRSRNGSAAGAQIHSSHPQRRTSTTTTASRASVAIATMLLWRGFRLICCQQALQALTRTRPGCLSRSHVAPPHHRPVPACDPGPRRGEGPACTRTYYRATRCGASWRVGKKRQIRKETPHRPRRGVFRLRLRFQLKPCRPSSTRTRLPHSSLPPACPGAPARPPTPDPVDASLPVGRFFSSIPPRNSAS